MTFTPADLSCDAFLDGRIRLWQPVAGYRAATDPVLLAAFVPARPGQRVLDLGCGAGAACAADTSRVRNKAVNRRRIGVCHRRCLIQRSFGHALSR